MSNEAPRLDDGRVSIEARALEPGRVIGTSFGSLDFLFCFSRTPFFAPSLFITSAKALPTEERVIVCLIFVGGFVGRAAPREIVGSAVGIVRWTQLSELSNSRLTEGEPVLTD